MNLNRARGFGPVIFSVLTLPLLSLSVPAEEYIKTTEVFYVFFFFYSIAINFMDSKFFCKNSYHMKGEALMVKRHLEILGYRVVQVRF